MMPARPAHLDRAPFRRAASIVVAVMLLAARGAAAQDSGPPQLEIGPLIGEGDQLAKDQRGADKALGDIKTEEPGIQRIKEASDRELTDWGAKAADFNSRCNHRFFEGQEAQAAQCAQERDQALAHLKDMSARHAKAEQAHEALTARKRTAETQSAQTAVKIDFWRVKMRVASAARGCAPGAEGETLMASVARYRQCWDLAAPASDRPVIHRKP